LGRIRRPQGRRQTRKRGDVLVWLVLVARATDLERGLLMPAPADGDDTPGSLLAVPGLAVPGLAAPGLAVPGARIEAPRRAARQRKLEAQTASGHTVSGQSVSGQIVSRQIVSGTPHLRQDLAAALARVARGDRSALEPLYGASSVKLYGIVQRILGRQDWADAVLEDVYVRVWERAGDFNGASGSPDAWLASLARNSALDDTRRAGPLQELPGSFGEPGAVGSARQSEELRRLSACRNGLPSEGREIVLLAYHYGLTREQIARRVNRPVATVKGSLRRSLKQLKECLGQ
jgi:RNA polymerase sigma-70 factor, ECF subfamily